MRNSNLSLALVFLAGLLARSGGAQGGVAAKRPPPVLVELFTSQGCSSCPAAERLLNDWGMDLFRQDKILPLAFHVDYWDYLGWKDPYSSPLFADRQKRYAVVFGADSLYTPQMVVDGRTGFVGSDAQRAAKEVKAGRGSGYPFALSLSASPKKGRLELEIGFHPLVAVPPNSDLRVFAVLFENNLSTKVAGGENTGRTLAEDFVVRSLQEVKTPEGVTESRIPAFFPWDPSWRPQNVGAAVFLQDMVTMEIKAVDWVYPLAR